MLESRGVEERMITATQTDDVRKESIAKRLFHFGMQFLSISIISPIPFRVRVLWSDTFAEHQP